MGRTLGGILGHRPYRPGLPRLPGHRGRVRLTPAEPESRGGSPPIHCRRDAGPGDVHPHPQGYPSRRRSHPSQPHLTGPNSFHQHLGTDGVRTRLHLPQPLDCSGMDTRVPVPLQTRGWRTVHHSPLLPRSRPLPQGSPPTQDRTGPLYPYSTLPSFPHHLFPTCVSRVSVRTPLTPVPCSSRGYPCSLSLSCLPVLCPSLSPTPCSSPVLLPLSLPCVFVLDPAPVSYPLPLQFPCPLSLPWVPLSRP